MANETGSTETLSRHQIEDMIYLAGGREAFLTGASEGIYNSPHTQTIL